MIEKYYASHIKTSIDAAAVNRRKSLERRRSRRRTDEGGESIEITN
jgi:hypothetical protein